MPTDATAGTPAWEKARAAVRAAHPEAALDIRQANAVAGVGARWFFVVDRPWPANTRTLSGRRKSKEAAWLDAARRLRAGGG